MNPTARELLNLIDQVLYTVEQIDSATHDLVDAAPPGVPDKELAEMVEWGGAPVNCLNWLRNAVENLEA